MPTGESTIPDSSRARRPSRSAGPTTAFRMANAARSRFNASIGHVIRTGLLPNAGKSKGDERVEALAAGLTVAANA